ncbi:hypothetical protein PFY10_19935 [Chryseobacterium daecheongense]|nr:hypothetical protein PFY10_19935 [Chryseobacterium daecheongense]
MAIGTASSGLYNPAKPGVFISQTQNIGFGTATPQTVFHIDAAKNNNINSAPTSDQQIDDIAITSSGKMGIGIATPDTKLEVRENIDSNAITISSSDSSYKSTIGNYKDGLGRYMKLSSIWGDDGRAFAFETGDGEAMTITKKRNVGIGTTNPHPSAILELSSTTQGFLPPRMTTVQRDAIASKTQGLMIYNTSVNIMQYYNGTAWVNYN